MLEDQPEDFVDPYLNEFDPEDEQWEPDYDGPMFPERSYEDN